MQKVISFFLPKRKKNLAQSKKKSSEVDSDSQPLATSDKLVPDFFALPRKKKSSVRFISFRFRCLETTAASDGFTENVISYKCGKIELWNRTQA